MIMPSNGQIDQIYDEIRDFADLSFRGFYPNYLYKPKWSGSYSSVQAQFFHFFSSSLAIGYSLSGIEGLVRVPAVIGTMAVWAAYQFSAAFVDRKYATAAALLLGLCPAQIWGARITQTEEICQWVFLIASFFFASALKNFASKNKLLVLSGVLLGSLNLIRIDGCLLGLGMLLCVCLLNLFRKKDGNWNLLAISYFFVSVPSFMIDFKLSDVYINGHSSYVYPVLGASCFLLLIINVGILNSVRIQKAAEFIMDKVKSAGIKAKNFSIMIAIVAAALFLYLWFIRPLNQGVNADYDFWQRCFREFFEYLPLISYPLFFIGIYYLLTRRKELEGMELFTVIGLITSFAYIYRPAIASDHIWASRRWVTSVFPFVLILAVVGIAIWAETYKGKKFIRIFLPLALAAYSVFFMLWQSRGFLFHPLLGEMREQYDRLASELDEDHVYFAEMSHFGSYLRFLYDKNVVVLDEEKEENFRDYINNTVEAVYFIGDIDSLKFKYKYKILYEGEIKGTYLYQTRYALPSELSETGSKTNIYELTSALE